MKYSISNCGILIIAAGESKRLGSPKQLLIFEGQTLINRLIGIVRKDGNFPLTVVLGANAEKIQEQLESTDLSVVINEEWVEGMAGSIRIGLSDLIQNNQNMDGVMILVCDQPFINEEQIRSLIELQDKEALPIAACYYANVLGTPALFHQTVFQELLNLKGDIGAKKIMQQREAEVAKLHFDQGVVDIDTMEDYEHLLKVVFQK